MRVAPNVSAGAVSLKGQSALKVHRKLILPQSQAPHVPGPQHPVLNPFLPRLHACCFPHWIHFHSSSCFQITISAARIAVCDVCCESVRSRKGMSARASSISAAPHLLEAAHVESSSLKSTKWCRTLTSWGQGGQDVLPVSPSRAVLIGQLRSRKEPLTTSLHATTMSVVARAALSFSGKKAFHKLNFY